jgi:glycogen phosphorylase
VNIISVTVEPNIPAPLEPLREIAHNLWVSWNFDAISLFMRLDHDAWLASHQNPVKTLGLVPQARLDEMSRDDSFLAALSRVHDRFRSYIDGSSWFAASRGNAVAYFSMEYGLDESLPVYSGGLGMLAGDHLKSASDLGLPLVGVGLLYRQGYFQQYLNPDGFQQESYPENDWYTLPVEFCRDAEGRPVTVKVELGSDTVVAQVWRVPVGRTSLYLLDTNITENSERDRLITAALYGGDRDMRIRQEIVLGIGGLRALKALGIVPAVTHMNEGHSAFLALERMRCLVKERGLSFREALEATRPTNVFTTHTPVPAGNERFSLDLMHRYFSATAEALGVGWEEFLSLGREHPENRGEEFCLTVLALKASAYSNGVSRLHGSVSRAMWSALWPGLPRDEVPITHITNGVHPRTWISHDGVDLYDRYLGPRFQDEPWSPASWERVRRISDDELWRTHERRRERLVSFVRFRMQEQLARRGVPQSELALAEEALSPYALTICFARRFATYKRGNLLLKDPERLVRLLSDAERPVQLIFAGKAHPHDMQGKEMIREIVHFSRDPRVRSRMVFLEDYDMTISRHLVSGSDVWLNAPRRPQEASGTSGMKAAMNGSLNLSILDGWWEEAYAPEIGWAIGGGEEYTDPVLQDEIERKALYDILEHEVVPTFYARGRDGLPREWIRRMKASIEAVGRRYNSHRMLIEYAERSYFPALRNYERYAGDGCDRARRVAAYLDRLRGQWDQVRITSVSAPAKAVLKAGETLQVRVKVRLGSLEATEVGVQLYYGRIASTGALEQARWVDMSPGERGGDGEVEYAAEVVCAETGRIGYTARLLPSHPDLVDARHYGLLRWA